MAIVVALLAVLAFGISHEGANNSLQSDVARGDYVIAPDATAKLPILGSGSHSESLADFRGKVVLLNLFASWCPPCQAEAPVMARAQKLLAAHGGTVLGVTYEDNPGAALAFMKSYHLDYPVVRDINGNFANAYGVNGVPDTFVINRAGKVQALNEYQLTDAWVEKTLPKILDESS